MSDRIHKLSLKWEWCALSSACIVASENCDTMFPNIMQSNITRKYIHHCRNWDRISITAPRYLKYKQTVYSYVNIPSGFIAVRHLQCLHINTWLLTMHEPRCDGLFQAYDVIKSPQYTGGDFMFLYRFVRRRRRRRRRPQILVHAITFKQLFGFLSFLAWLLALTYRLTD